MINQIPLPLNTKLYQVLNGAIVIPKISIASFNKNCNLNNYSDLQYNTYLYQLYNQNVNYFNLSFNDKSVSSFITGKNYNINGFNNGLIYRFLNYSSPTIIFLPVISVTDIGQNVPIVLTSSNIYTITNWQNYLNNTNLSLNNLVLLTNQSVVSQNILYRVQNITPTVLTIYYDSTINTPLLLNQNQIFVRAMVNTGTNIYYYGCVNSPNAFNWISQTVDVFLGTVDYGVTLPSDLNSLTLDISIFKILGLSPKINQKVAININSGGYTTGIYVISNISGNIIYLQPIYAPYVFVHQFIKVNYDFSVATNSIWFVNPLNLGATNWIYGSVQFTFNTMNISNIISTPNSWGQQVGGIYDQILGFVLYTNSTSNPYILNSDIFSMTVYVPSTGFIGNSFLSGLSLDTSYSNNLLQFVGENY